MKMPATIQVSQQSTIGLLPINLTNRKQVVTNVPHNLGQVQPLAIHDFGITSRTKSYY